MPASPDRAPTQRRKLLFLIALTLVSSAFHFADNAFHLDRYPGPRWLTRNVILISWPLVLAAALAAYRSRARWALLLYAVLGFAGLAHYLMPHARALPLRCAVSIGAETLASTLLLLYAATHSGPDA